MKERFDDVSFEVQAVDYPALRVAATERLTQFAAGSPCGFDLDIKPSIVDGIGRVVLWRADVHGWVSREETKVVPMSPDPGSAA